MYHNLVFENNDFSSEKSMVLLNTVYTSAFDCFETCKKYNRAQSSMFSDKSEMESFFSFLTKTTTDPVTNNFYKDSLTTTVWLPMR